MLQPTRVCLQSVLLRIMSCPPAIMDDEDLLPSALPGPAPGCARSAKRALSSNEKVAYVISKKAVKSLKRPRATSSSAHMIPEVPSNVEEVFGFMHHFLDSALAVQQGTCWKDHYLCRVKPEHAFPFFFETIDLSTPLKCFNFFCTVSGPHISLPKEVHVCSEFSGYGTAEIAIESVANLLTSRGHAVRVTTSSADISRDCRSLLAANAQPGSCLFGDILSLLPKPIYDEAHAEVFEPISVTSEQLTHAMPKKVKLSTSLDWLLTKQGRMKVHAGDIRRDYRLVGKVGENGSLDEKASWSSVLGSLQRLLGRPGESGSYIFARRTYNCVNT